MVFSSALTVALALAAAIPVYAGNVLPGIKWYDTAGNPLQAHGGGITQVDGYYYLIGENKAFSSSNYFKAVSCYKSKDLLAWEYVNDLLTIDTNTPDLSNARVIERPKVIFNSKTRKYVMWMHVDSPDYKDAKAGVAVSDSVCGKYTYLSSSRPLGNQSRDMTLYQDDDGTAYLVSEDRSHGTHFYKLSADYLTVESDVGLISYSFMPALEAPAVAKKDGLYYFFGSRLTGWNTNDNQYTTAKSLSGPWAPAALFAPSGSKTCNSQTTFALKTPKGKYMYMGDRWEPNNLGDSRYIWEPLVLDTSAKTASITCRDSWPTSEVGV